MEAKDWKDVQRIPPPMDKVILALYEGKEVVVCRILKAPATAYHNSHIPSGIMVVEETNDDTTYDASYITHWQDIVLPGGSNA